MAGISWRDFELLIGEAYRQRGYHVTETGGGGADGGVDLVLSKGRETWLVQCKQWRATKVSVQIVRELLGVMTARGATGAYVVTSGSFTAEARAFVEGRNIELVDGPELLRLIGSVPASEEMAFSQPVAETPAALSCPKCAATMVIRMARDGPPFWGCSKFPQCRGTRDL